MSMRLKDTFIQHLQRTKAINIRLIDRKYPLVVVTLRTAMCSFYTAQSVPFENRNLQMEQHSIMLALQQKKWPFFAGFDPKMA